MKYACELEIPGRDGGCGAPADCGVGLIDPVTDRYMSAPLACAPCLRRFCAETTTRFRRMEIPHALRTQAALDGDPAPDRWVNALARLVRVGDVTPVGTVEVWEPVLPGVLVLLTIDGVEYTRDWNALISVRPQK